MTPECRGSRCASRTPKTNGSQISVGLVVVLETCRFAVLKDKSYAPPYKCDELIGRTKGGGGKQRGADSSGLDATGNEHTLLSSSDSCVWVRNSNLRLRLLAI